MTEKFLINTLTAWDEPPRARHQVAHALAEMHQVVFVTRNRFGLWGMEVEQVHERFTLITPSYPMDFRLRIRIPVINAMYQRWLYRRLEKDYRDYVVVNFDFTGHHIFKYFNRVVYYCNDEILGNSKYPNWFTDQYYKWCEKKLIRGSMLCITTSPYLTRKLTRLNSRTFEIPLGANSVLEDAVFTRGKEDGKIVVCLMGFINERQISVDLINEVISLERIHLELIGPAEDSFVKKLISLSGVTIRGVLKGKDLVNALSEIDVGLALYNTKRVNPGGSPNKIWQYLGVGKPAVVSYLENIDIHQFPPHSVYLHHEGDSLRDLIIQAHREDSEALLRERIEFTRNNTWEKRVEVFLDILDRTQKDR
jgi:hypothetical protein